MGKIKQIEKIYPGQFDFEEKPLWQNQTKIPEKDFEQILNSIDLDDSQGLVPTSTPEVFRLGCIKHVGFKPGGKCSIVSSTGIIYNSSLSEAVRIMQESGFASRNYEAEKAYQNQEL